MNKIFFLFLFLIFIILKSNTQITSLIPKEGIKNISYEEIEEEETKIKFEIPLEETNDVQSINLTLSEPKTINRANCISHCKIQTNIMYCEILKSECELLSQNSKIKIVSILGESYEFSNYYLLASEVNFEVSSIEMTCSNFYLSFFLKTNDLNKNTYENIDFSFPIYYRDIKENAKCIFPKMGQYIPCLINATQILFKKGYSITFDNNPIKLTDDINLNLNMIKKYKLEDDCGKDINNSFNINHLSFFKKIKLFLLIFFIFCFHL